MTTALLHRPNAYYNIDGVGELGIGVMLLGYSLLQWFQVHSSRDSVWNSMYTLFIFVGLLGALIHHGSKAIKKHITHPRTGYVEYRRQDRLWRPLLLGMGASAVLAAGFSVLLRWHWGLTTFVALAGLFLAACYAHGIARTVPWKWAVFGAMVLCAILIAILPASLLGAVAGGSWITAQFPASFVGAFLIFFVFNGTLYLVSGGISFWLYLRRTQPAPEEAE